MSISYPDKLNGFVGFTKNLQIFCRGYLLCNFFKNSEISSQIPKCCLNNAFRQFINGSYFSVIIPVLVLIIFTVVTFTLFFLKVIFCCLKPSHPSVLILPVEEKVELTEEQGVEQKHVAIKLTEEQIEILTQSLRKESSEIFKGRENINLKNKGGEIEWLSERGVFRHRDIPELIFRIPLSSKTPKEAVKGMFNFANNCWSICEENSLTLLRVPNVGIEVLKNIHGKDRYVLVMEKLDFKPSHEDQFNLRKQCLESPKTLKQLEELERQLVSFQFISRYRDVSLENIPILNRESEEAPLQAGIIDFDLFQAHLWLGLKGNSFQYYSRRQGLFFILETKVALEEVFKKARDALSRDNLEAVTDLEELSVYLHTLDNKIREFYNKSCVKKRYQQGGIDCSEMSEEDFLLCSSNEEIDDYFHTCSDEKLAYAAAKELVLFLNREMLRRGREPSTASAKSCIDAFRGKIRDALNKDVIDDDRLHPNPLEGFKESVLNLVCKVFVAKGWIVDFRFNDYGLHLWF